VGSPVSLPPGLLESAIDGALATMMRVFISGAAVAELPLLLSDFVTEAADLNCFCNKLHEIITCAQPTETWKTREYQRCLCTEYKKKSQLSPIKLRHKFFKCKAKENLLKYFQSIRTKIVSDKNLFNYDKCIKYLFLTHSFQTCTNYAQPQAPCHTLLCAPTTFAHGAPRSAT
jgi:hypothetical protein